MAGLSAALGLPYTDAVVIAGSLVLGITSGVLGAFAVLRRRSLVGDAVAHATLPGVCVAFLVAGAKDVPGLLVGAALAGLVAALLMVGIERASRIRPDAAIGVVLSGFFAIGVVLLTHLSNSADADQAGLENYLFGQAAGLLERDIAVMAALAAAALVVVAVLRRALTTTLFDPGYAGSIGLPVRALETLMTALLVVAVVIGVRVVGAILMVAMLVVPTAAARQLADRFGAVLVLAGLIGAAVGVTGALTATRAQLPTGPVVVLTGFVVVMAALLLAPGRGVVWRARRLAARRRTVLRDAVLAHPDAPVTGLRDRLVRAELRRRGLLTRDGALTPAGEAAAREAAERRALWTAWLEHGSSIRLPDAREPDPTDLRGSLGDDAVAQLRARAGKGAADA
ncbi:MAG TPA: iron chelate uptake ABC transporter family permease subunit [Pseudonocardia sp.]|uniref:iron chelate uptake ABC transporter family permease subunit n=1 Tax=Pseudonocardia sp. TaxID=60912 RepID=UPI002B4AC418|nr:iron chelate uptake ABC transporter family permease subunit [Pseudonocardia sp.]HLU54527.1 iron chelate uptake ABC transporter family permease subunit [Pseudonocardia sp.]